MPIVRLDPDLPLPSYAHPGDAGLDLRAREDGVVPPGGGRLLMPTGIAIAIPLGYAGFVLPRSGNALNHGLTMANSPGLIDSAYRGEVKVILLNTDPQQPFVVTWRSTRSAGDPASRGGPLARRRVARRRRPRRRFRPHRPLAAERRRPA